MYPLCVVDQSVRGRFFTHLVIISYVKQTVPLEMRTDYQGQGTNV